jgi:Tfp pilus assembly protein PilP
MKLADFLLVLPILLLLFGCSPAKPTANPNLVWKVDVLKSEVKDKLESIETVNQYVGSTDVLHQQYPAEGNVYLIMKVIISKQGTDPAPFDWTKLTVQDQAGNTYPRVSNDTFLEQFNYIPRMTGLEIKLGENEGWVCYEIPAQAAKGMLTLTYTAEGSQQEIVVKR